MDGSVNDLVEYRLSRAEEELEDSQELFKNGNFRLSLNRSYYAIFHAIRAVNALDGFDSSKHSGVIAHFNHYHVKTEEFPKEVSRMISDREQIMKISLSCLVRMRKSRFVTRKQW